MNKVLIIEDEANFARFVELELIHEGYTVKVASDGKKGLKLALEEDWDLILLDVMLPGMNGFEVCRQFRLDKHTPVIMLTARDSVVDRVSGLDSGADDYIPKPFAIEELLARMRAIKRRVEHEEENQSLLSFKDLRLDPNTRLVTKGAEQIVLTKREFDLLAVFMSNVSRVLTRSVLLDNVWGYDAEVETNVVDVYVRYLRNKLGDPGEQSYIQTLRGIGYVLR
jgi:DNA-binding response OmpR family regulator